MSLHVFRGKNIPTLVAVLVAVTIGCSDPAPSEVDAGAADAGDTGGTTCSTVDITESYADATPGPCTSAAGLAIADSMMNLDGITIDNNGATMTPCVEVQCDDDYAYIVANGLPHYDFVQTTPNELAEDVNVYRIPLAPSDPAGTDAVDISSMTGCQDAYAAYVAGDAPNNDPANFCADAASGYLTEDLADGTRTYAQIACLGYFGALINGVNVNGPNEGPFPDPWGNPAFSYPDDASTSNSGALDYCGGHTGGNMHYHAVHEPCLETDAEMRPSVDYADAVLNWSQLGALADDCTAESPIVGWSTDGYPIKGPCVCLERDGNGDCTSVKKARSGWQYDGLSSHDANPDASLALEGTDCTLDDDCCPGGTDNCKMRCNYTIVDGAQAGTEVGKICTVLDYSWCTGVYHDRTAADTSAENFVYLDRCNGYTGVDGFAYHATGSFPYLQGCFRGEPAEQAPRMGGPGGPPPGPPVSPGL